MFARHWLVCDMDGTLTSTPTKAGGEYKSLQHSPCYQPLRRYLANGGNLCVVSTAGRRMWRQIFSEVSDVLFAPSTSSAAAKGCGKAGRLAICGFSGAALFLSDPATKSMKEVTAYRETALKYNKAALYGQVKEDRAGGIDGAGGAATSGTATARGHSSSVGHSCISTAAERQTHHFTESTTIDAFNKDAIVDIAVDRARTFINDAADELLLLSKEDATVATDLNFITPLVKRLSTKYHEPYMHMARQRNAYLAEALGGKQGEAPQPLSELDFETTSTLLQRFYAEVMPKDRLMTHGSIFPKTNDALIDIQSVPETDPPVGVQVTMMGIPMALYKQYITADIEAELASYGVSAKAQPNSVAINKKGIDKALCVQWLKEYLHTEEEGSFALERSLGFGDIPSSVDKPLAQFPPMQFISCSTTPATDPTDTKGKIVFVGREEEGCADFLNVMLDDVLGTAGGSDAVASAPSGGDDVSLFAEARVAAWAAKARGSYTGGAY